MHCTLIPQTQSNFLKLKYLWLFDPCTASSLLPSPRDSDDNESSHFFLLLFLSFGYPYVQYAHSFSKTGVTPSGSSKLPKFPIHGRPWYPRFHQISSNSPTEPEWAHCVLGWYFTLFPAGPYHSERQHSCLSQARQRSFHVSPTLLWSIFFTLSLLFTHNYLQRRSKTKTRNN